MVGWITLILRWRQDRNTSVLLLSAFCSNFVRKKKSERVLCRCGKRQLIHEPNALNSQIQSLTEMLCVFGGTESEMCCAPGRTQNSHLQITDLSLYKELAKRIACLLVYTIPLS